MWLLLLLFNVLSVAGDASQTIAVHQHRVKVIVDLLLYCSSSHLSRLDCHVIQLPSNKSFDTAEGSLDLQSGLSRAPHSSEPHPTVGF